MWEYKIKTIAGPTNHPSKKPNRSGSLPRTHEGKEESVGEGQINSHHVIQFQLKRHLVDDGSEPRRTQCILDRC